MNLIQNILSGFSQASNNFQNAVHGLFGAQPKVQASPISIARAQVPQAKAASDGVEFSTKPLYPTANPAPVVKPQVQTNPIQTAQTLARNPNLSTYNVAPPVRSAIQQAATQYQLPVNLLGDIALQESSFNPNLVNTTPAGKQAGNPTGLFQFTDSTWNQILNQYNNKPGMTLHLPNANRADPLTNAMAAAYLIKNGQLGKWEASKGVWGQYYKPEELKSYYSQTLGYR